MKQAKPAEGNVGDVVYSNKLKQNHKSIHENVTFTLGFRRKILSKK